MKASIEELLKFVKRGNNFLLGNVSLEHGLMPAYKPLEKLPPNLSYIDDLLADLPQLYRAGKVCASIINLPRPSSQELQTLQPLERVRLNIAYGFLAYSFRYAWEDCLEHAKFTTLPKVQLAIAPADQRNFSSFEIGNTCIRFISSNIIEPWKLNWENMGRVRPYFESSLFTENFVLRKKPLSNAVSSRGDSRELLFQFFQSDTEKNFLLGVQEVTAKFNCLPLLLAMQQAMVRTDHAEIVELIDQLVDMWQLMTEDVFMRFDTRIDPVEWGSTLGKWTASPFYKQEGFSGMFFPAFHILDLLLKRVEYESFLGDLIIKTRAIMPPNWQQLFQSVGEYNLKDYIVEHGAANRQLTFGLSKLQDVYQDFFKLHRRKVFSYEYQAILTGRNSTNAGISAEVKTNNKDTVYDLCTWNKIDDILKISGDERPCPVPSNKMKCPFSGKSSSSPEVEKYPRMIRVSSADETVLQSGEKNSRATTKSTWKKWDSPVAGVYGIVLENNELAVKCGDRCVLYTTLNAEKELSAEKSAGSGELEAEFVGDVSGGSLILRTAVPVKNLVGYKLVRGTFSRAPGEGINHNSAAGSSVLVVAQVGHSAIATVLQEKVKSAFKVVLVGEDETVLEREAEFCRSLGVEEGAMILLGSLEEASLKLDSALSEFGEGLFYVAGEGSFLSSANEFIYRSCSATKRSYHQWLEKLRLEKRKRVLCYRQEKASRPLVNYYSWDLLESTDSSALVALNGELLDITDFRYIHFGGDNILNLLTGVDITEEFERAHPNRQVAMPASLSIGSYEVPEQLRDCTAYAYKLVRARNVLSLNKNILAPYADSSHVYTQRLLGSLLSIEVQLLWSETASRVLIQPFDRGRSEALSRTFKQFLQLLNDSLQLPERRKNIAIGLMEELTLILSQSIQELVQIQKQAGPYLPIEEHAAAECFERQLIRAEACLESLVDQLRENCEAPVASLSEARVMVS